MGGRYEAYIESDRGCFLLFFPLIKKKISLALYVAHFYWPRNVWVYGFATTYVYDRNTEGSILYVVARFAVANFFKICLNIIFTNFRSNKCVFPTTNCLTLSQIKMLEVIFK